VAAGARAGADAAGCAREADVLITMLPGPAEVEDVLLGAGGALAALPRGAVAVDMGTGSGDVGRRVLEAARPRGIGVLDAPVADALRAPEGLLTIFVGGDAADVARVRPVLEAMGDPDRIIHVGPQGAGATVKLLVNLQWFVHAAAAAEALVVGARAGLDVETLHRALATGPSRSSFLEHGAADRVVERDLHPLGELEALDRAGDVADDLLGRGDLAEERRVHVELAPREAQDAVDGVLPGHVAARQLGIAAGAAVASVGRARRVRREVAGRTADVGHSDFLLRSR
jgi:3-hydroxyisobutyrate dehydrogenase-like beta-hydroxyacid dehydrogenase